MAAEKLRIAFIGVGTIIRDYHVPVLLKNSRAELVAAGNLRDTHLNALARDFSIPKTYTDFELLAQDPDIDAVIIGLPNYLHCPVAIQMLQAGKHVLLEKPMAMTVAEAESIIAAADACGCKLMIAQMWRFDQEIIWLRDIIKAGTLGTIFKIKAHHVWANNGPKTDSWAVQPKYSGGGVIADMAVHPIDTISFLFGDEVDPVRLFARTNAYHHKIEVEDTANIMIEYDNAAVAMIEAGWYHSFSNGEEGTIEVFGTKGYARVFPAELRCEIDGVQKISKPSMPTRSQQCDLPMYAAQDDHFIDCVLNDKEPSPDGRIGLRSIKTMQAAYRSAQSGESVCL